MTSFPQHILDCDFLSGISDSLKIKILNHFKIKSIKRNSLLFDAGKSAKLLYIVYSGEFIIERKIENLDSNRDYKPVAYSQPGDLLGEVSMLSGDKHSTRVRAKFASKVLYILKKEAFELFQKYPLLALNVGQTEAKRLRATLIGIKKHTLQKKIIVHITGFSGDESHYIGMNLAASMAQITDYNIPYLHLSHSKQTPIASLKLETKFNRLQQAVNNLKKYQFSETEKLILKHESGLLFLPSTESKLPINLLKKTDIPRLLSLLNQKYPFVFVECGSQKLNDPKILSVLKMADQIIMGFSSHKSCFNYVAKNLNMLKKNIPDLMQKLQFYYNDLSYSNNKVDKNQTLLYSQTIRGLNIPVEFKLKGKVASKEMLTNGGFLVLQNPTSKPAIHLRSIGRWLANHSMGIAFGGGGARALCEIGILRLIEEEKIHFDAVAATSMGSLIGALYAQGYNSYQIEDLFKAYLPNDKAVLDFGLPFLSFFKGKKANKLLKKLFGNKRIEDLPIPFTAIATDIISGKEVHIKTGLLRRAVRASMSLPAVFPPVKYKQYYLIDGGVLNNVPGDVLRLQKINLVLGINCTPFADRSIERYFQQANFFQLIKPQRHYLKNLLRSLKTLKLMVTRPPILQIANRSMGLEGAELIKQKIHHFDLLLNPPIQEFGLFEFNRIEELIKVGYDDAKANLEKIREIFTLT